MPLSDVQARIHRLDGYSGHAPQNDLVRWYLHEGPRASKRLFLTHGSHNARFGLHGALVPATGGASARIDQPCEPGATFDLDRGVWEKSITRRAA